MAAEMPGPWQGRSTADPTTRPLPAQTLGRSSPKGCTVMRGGGVGSHSPRHQPAKRLCCGAQSIAAGVSARAAEHWRLQSLNKLEIRLNFLPQFHKLRFLRLLSRPDMLSAMGNSGTEDATLFQTSQPVWRCPQGAALQPARPLRPPAKEFNGSGGQYLPSALPDTANLLC